MLLLCLLRISSSLLLSLLDGLALSRGVLESSLHLTQIYIRDQSYSIAVLHHFFKEVALICLRVPHCFESSWFDTWLVTFEEVECMHEGGVRVFSKSRQNHPCSFLSIDHGV